MDADDPAPLHRQAICKIFEKAAKRTTPPRIGIEGEKIGIIVKTGKNANYTGKNGYLAILGKLYEELGWEITSQDGKFILQLQRGTETLNLESDGRIELAGSPHDSLHDLAREFRIHQNEISEISDVFGIGWLGIGYHPTSKNEEIEDMPAERKQLLTRYFEVVKEQTGNDFGLAWFKKTAGIHVSMDYFSEEDFARKGKLFTKLAPLLNAMFANSPFSNNEFTGYLSYRSHVTLNNGLSQFQVSEELYNSDFGYDDWIDHLYTLPFLFIQRDTWEPVDGMTFAQYAEHGYKDYKATMHDYMTHTKTAWKDVKLKEVIELRCFDSLPPSIVPSVGALIKGLAYDSDALGVMETMTGSWHFPEFQQLQQDAARYGLKAKIKDVSLLDLAKQLIEVAEESLKKVRILDAYGRDESQYLQPIKEFIFVKEMSPAEWLVEQWNGEWGQSFFPVFKWCQY